MERKKKLINKKHKKLVDEKCCFCGEDDYCLLDSHRIVEGKDGGEYTKFNTLTVCCKCHRKIHAEQITIDKKYYSTKGWLLHYFIDGEEFWIKL